MKDNLSNIESQLLVMAAQGGSAEALEKRWAYRIATNKSMDWLKNKTKNQHINLDSGEIDCRNKDDDLRVRELVQKLKNDSRAVLSLYYFERLSITEISIALNIPQGTVKSRLFRARDELKQLWEKYFGN